MEQMEAQIINFHGTRLLAEQSGDEVWVAVRPVCEGIGVHTDKQVLRIKNDDILGRVHTIRHVHDSTNRLQEMLCLPIRYVHGWLFSIESSKVSPEVRPRLLLFKQECYAVLYEHFFGNARRLQLDSEREHALLLRNKEINRLVRASLEEHKTNVLEIQAIQNRRAETYHLEPIHTGAEYQLKKRRFLENPQLSIESQLDESVL